MTAARGRTVITARALERLASALAGEAARVPPRRVNTRLSDAAGSLAVSVAVPIALGGDRRGSVAERGDEVRERLRRGLRELAERGVSEVDVTFTGVLRTEERRVR